jgi:cytochrome P450
VLPAFHRERLLGAVDTMTAETERAIAGWRTGDEVDLYHWARGLALRIAMRALFGFDPDRRGGDRDLAEEFERALGYYGQPYAMQILRGPASPWRRMHRSRVLLDRVIYGEIAERRRSPRRGEDILSLLMEATDEDGAGFSDRELRDQVMTLLFAGHDTTTSTVSFLFYELARHPEVLDRLLDEQDRVLGGRAPGGADLMGGLPLLEMALDETLRLYPPAWVGPRRAVDTFEFDGHLIAGGTPVHYCSWASHRLPEVFPEPDEFRPERFTREARAALPKGAYLPFGGGSRTCIGMRFGQLEIRTTATLILRRFRLDLRPGYRLEIRQMPTLSPRDGLPMIIAPRVARDSAADRA